jgi:hypothetical protein
MSSTLTGSWHRLGLIALVSLALTFPLFVARSQFLTGDPTFYVGLAESLASGQGYTLMGQPHTTYPPGLPLLLAPFAAVAGCNVLLTQVVIAAFAPISLVAVLAFLRQYDARAQLMVGGLLALGFPFFVFATQDVRSELPFLTASALALRLVYGPPPKVLNWWALVAVGALTAATVLFRTIGIALPAAFLVTWVHRRIRRLPSTSSDRALLVGGAAGLLAAALWFGWVSSNDTPSYADRMLMLDPHEPDLGPATVASLLARIPGSLARQVAHLVEAATGIRWMLATWLSPVTVLLTALLIIGLGRELRSPNPVLGWYLLGYGGILLLWPFDEGVRFILPVFPFLLLLVWRGSAWAIGAANVRPSAWLGLAALALTFVALIVVRGQDFPLRSRQGSAILAAWVFVGAAAIYFWHRGGSIHLGPWAKRISMLFFAAFVIANLPRTASAAISQLRGRETGAGELKPAVKWLRDHGAPDQVVMAQLASTVYFYTGLRTIRLPITRNRATLLQAIRQYRPTYLVILDRPDDPYYRPTEVDRLAIIQAEAGPEAFHSVYRFPAGNIYQVR